MTDPLHTEPGDLLPCPFCGGEASLNAPRLPCPYDTDDVLVSCNQCDVSGPSILFDQDVHGETDLPALEAEAIAAWNTRTAAEAASRDAIEDWKGEAAYYRHEAGALAADLAASRAREARLREALEDTQATLSAIRASLTGDAALRDLQHIFGLAGEQMVRNRAALSDAGGE